MNPYLSANFFFRGHAQRKRFSIKRVGKGVCSAISHNLQHGRTEELKRLRKKRQNKEENS